MRWLLKVSAGIAKQHHRIGGDFNAFACVLRRGRRFRRGCDLGASSRVNDVVFLAHFARAAVLAKKFMANGNKAQFAAAPGFFLNVFDGGLPHMFSPMRSGSANSSRPRPTCAAAMQPAAKTRRARRGRRGRVRTAARLPEKNSQCQQGGKAAPEVSAAAFAIAFAPASRAKTRPAAREWCRAHRASGRATRPGFAGRAHSFTGTT